jgi:ABC-type transport system involved in multi-copper enzyme maturation permease subunit
MSDLLASFRGEWFKVTRRPATWALVLTLALLLLALGYALLVVLVAVLDNEPAGRPGVQAGLHTLKMSLAPLHFLQSTLAGFSGIGFGSAIAVILGVLAVGSEYGWSTLKTVFTQRPGRLTVFGGKLLTLAAILAILSVVLLASAAGASAVTGAIYGSPGGWPGVVDVAKAFLACWLIMGLWAAFGVFLSVLFKQAPLAIGLGIVYTIAIEGLVINILSVDSSLKNIQRGFPGANATALVNSFGSNSASALVGPTQAILVVAAFLVVFVLVSAVLLRVRDVI